MFHPFLLTIMSCAKPTVVDLNTQSVAHLQKGQYEEAGEVMAVALEAMKALPPPTTSPKDEENSTTATSFHIQSEDVLNSDFTDVFVAPSSLCEKRRIDSQHNMILTFYPRALQIRGVARTQEENTITLMAILYNLGLSLHLLALTGDSPTIATRSMFAKAAKLYQSAIQVAYNSIEGDMSGGYEYVLLAATNNLANIYADHLDIPSASGCVAMMKNIISYTSHLRQLAEDDYSFFETNIIAFLESPVLSIAPAA